MKKSIGHSIRKAGSQLGREFDQFAKLFDLTGMQMPITDFLSQGVKKEYFQQNIEKEFNIQCSTTMILSRRMEKKALIYCQVLQQDARQKSIRLTEKAQGLARGCRSYFRNQEKELEKNFPGEDIATFEKILQYHMKEE